jgi:hypothetical protein
MGLAQQLFPTGINELPRLLKLHGQFKQFEVIGLQIHNKESPRKSRQHRG